MPKFLMQDVGCSDGRFLGNHGRNRWRAYGIRYKTNNHAIRLHGLAASEKGQSNFR